MEVFTSNMLAIIKQMDMEHGCYIDKSRQFLILMLVKVFMDGGAMFLCCLRPLVSFLNMCSVSIVLVDLVLAVFMISTFWLDVATSHTALCYVMAHFSAAFSALPVPMLCLGILDYYLEDTYAGKKCMKLVRNPVLILIMWSLAGIYAHATVNATLFEETRKIKYIVCEIRESNVVTYSIITLTIVMISALLPYLLLLPRWVKEANRICAAREEIAHTRTSDLMIDMTTEKDTKCTEEETVLPCPPLHISLLLCFGVFWMPYLIVTTVCTAFEFGIPAYIAVNLLWVQCVNSLLAGVVFWLRSYTVGPYSRLPDNVCLWQVYWYLSKGRQHQLPMAVFKPSKGKGSTTFYI